MCQPWRYWNNAFRNFKAKVPKNMNRRRLIAKLMMKAIRDFWYSTSIDSNTIRPVVIPSIKLLKRDRAKQTLQPMRFWLEMVPLIYQKRLCQLNQPLRQSPTHRLLCARGGNFALLDHVPHSVHPFCYGRTYLLNVIWNLHLSARPVKQRFQEEVTVTLDDVCMVKSWLP